MSLIEKDFIRIILSFTLIFLLVSIAPPFRVQLITGVGLPVASQTIVRAISGGEDIEEPISVLNRFFCILRGGITSDVFRFFLITGGSK